MGVIIPNPTVETEDGATSVTNVKKIEVTDGTLTDDGSRIVSIDTSGTATAAGVEFDIQINDGSSGFAGGHDFYWWPTGGQLHLGRTATGTTSDIYGGTGGGDNDGEGLDLQIHASGASGIRSTIILAGEAGVNPGIVLKTSAGDVVRLLGDPGQTQIIDAGPETLRLAHGAGDKVAIYESTAPVLKLESSSNAIELTCDANKKLTIQGTADWVFDASSASGGVTFPDGTEQTTAASGGGGALTHFPVAPMTETPTTGSNVAQWPLFMGTSTLETTTNGVVNFNLTTCVYFPFYGVKTGDMSSITGKITGGIDDDLFVCVYNADSDNLPQNQIGDIATWDMGASGVITLDVSGLTDTWNITQGDLYYLAMMLKTDNTNRPTFYVYDPDEGHQFMMPRSNSATEAYDIENTHFIQSGLSGALPASCTPANLAPAFIPWNYVPKLGVVM